MFCFAGGFLAGTCCLYFVGLHVMADERTLAQLYPASVGLRISHNIRVLNAIEANRISQASILLRQDIDSNVNSLLGLQKSVALDKNVRNALVAGQNALKVP